MEKSSGKPGEAGKDMDRLRNQNGFSLVEIMVATLILAVAVLSAGVGILQIQNLSEVSRQKAVAVADANRVLEAMRDRANASLSNLQNTNWTTWAANNIILPRRVQGSQGSNEIQLSQENVVVNFNGNDPKRVTLTVNWMYQRGTTSRPYSYQVITQMTRRS